MSIRQLANIKYGETLNMAERDNLARQFNASKNADEKLSLLKKMKPYDKKLQKYIDESNAIIEADKKVDKLYARYEAERKKESENGT